MNWADYAILAVLGLSILIGLWRGFIGEVLALAIWVCAFWVAWMFGPRVAAQLPASLPTPSARIILAYVLCFITVLVLGALVAFVIRRLVEGSGLSGSDRVLGMGFGLVRGVALVALIVFLLGFTPFPRDPWWRESRLLPGFANVAHWLGEHVPAEVADLLKRAESAAQPWMPGTRDAAASAADDTGDAAGAAPPATPRSSATTRADGADERAPAPRADSSEHASVDLEKNKARPSLPRAEAKPKPEPVSATPAPAPTSKPPPRKTSDSTSPTPHPSTR